MTAHPPEHQYVLGTHDEELERLGLQHRVWRPKALDAWRRAGFTTGQSLLDIGCGPGYASLDLAEIAGPRGRVTAIDQSKRFLDSLAAKARQRELANIDIRTIDLDAGDLPDVQVDGAWCRWVLAFLRDPRRMVNQIARVVKPGGTFVSHEYFAYDTWKMMPPSEELAEFVRVVTNNWRASGGEPDIGVRLPQWLGEAGFEIVDVRTIVEVARPGSFVWEWPKSFIKVGTDRCVELGTMTAERAAELVAAFQRMEHMPNAMMLTPGLLEIVARRI